jgi:hypothetical protein
MTELKIYILQFNTNVPNEVLDINNVVPSRNRHFETTTKYGVADLLKLAIHQNYFKTNGTQWHQNDCTTTGSPISTILAEILLQAVRKESLSHHNKERAYTVHQ